MRDTVPIRQALGSDVPRSLLFEGQKQVSKDEERSVLGFPASRYSKRARAEGRTRSAKEPVLCGRRESPASSWTEHSCCKPPRAVSHLATVQTDNVGCMSDLRRNCSTDGVRTHRP